MTPSNNPRNGNAGPRTTNNDVEADVTPRREGGDDSLAESSPNDSSSDEKVIVNEQRSDKTVNSPAQSAVNTSEGNSNDEEIIDPVQGSDES